MKAPPSLFPLKVLQQSLHTTEAYLSSTKSSSIRVLLHNSSMCVDLLRSLHPLRTLHCDTNNLPARESEACDSHWPARHATPPHSKNMRNGRDVKAGNERHEKDMIGRGKKINVCEKENHILILLWIYTQKHHRGLGNNAEYEQVEITTRCTVKYSKKQTICESRWKKLADRTKLQKPKE